MSWIEGGNLTILCFHFSCLDCWTVATHKKSTNFYWTCRGAISAIYHLRLWYIVVCWLDVLQAHLTQWWNFSWNNYNSMGGIFWYKKHASSLHVRGGIKPLRGCEKWHPNSTIRKMPPFGQPFENSFQEKNLCCLVIGYKYFTNGIQLTNMTNSYCYLFLHLW